MTKQEREYVQEAISAMKCRVDDEHIGDMTYEQLIDVNARIDCLEQLLDKFD